jgi:hypothetical protein
MRFRFQPAGREEVPFQSVLCCGARDPNEDAASCL